MKANIIQEKSFELAIKTIELVGYLQNAKGICNFKSIVKGLPVLLGLMWKKAIGGQSDKGIFAKISIAYKEAREAKLLD